MQQTEELRHWVTMKVVLALGVWPKAKANSQEPQQHESPGSNGGARGRPEAFCADYFLLTAFLSSAPAVNFATLLAAILMGLPVWGLRPVRALR